MMKRKIFGALILTLLIVSACQDEAILTTPVQPDSEVSIAATSSAAPQWSSGYPASFYGATSVDLKLKTDIAATAYWVISTQALTLNANTLKAQAIKPSMAGIKFKGVSVLMEGKEKIEKPTGFLPATKYYAYIIAQGAVGNIFQPQIKQIIFTTHARLQTKEYHSVAENRTVLYVLYRPEEALKYPAKKFPICFFLAGTGEIAGQGKINVIKSGLLTGYLNAGNNVDMIVMTIQAVKKAWNLKMIDEGVIHSLATYSVDTKKVYMTGLSSGGYATWAYSLTYPTKMTAIVPISGGGNKTRACILKSIPVYAFHNSVDPTVNAAGDINMVNAINACPPLVQAKLTLFPDKGHNCWRRVYDMNHSEWSKSPNIQKVDIYKWMLSYSK